MAENKNQKPPSLKRGGLVSFYSRRAAAHANSDRYEEALSDYNNAIDAIGAIDLRDEKISLLLERARIYMKLGRYEEALSDSETAVSESDHRQIWGLSLKEALESYLLRSRVFIALGRYEEALPGCEYVLGHEDWLSESLYDRFSREAYEICDTAYARLKDSYTAPPNPRAPNGYNYA